MKNASLNLDQVSNHIMKTEFQFIPTLSHLISSRRTQGESGREFEGLASLSTVKNLATLQMLLESSPQLRTLEVGFAFGGSALLFAGIHRKQRRMPERQHVAIDPYQKSVWDNAGIENMKREGLLEYLDFRKDYSSVVLADLFHAGEKFDFIYIDGSHLFEDVFVDAYFAVRLLSPGGLVVFDDSSDPHVAKVIKFIRRNLKGRLTKVDLSIYRPEGLERVKYKVASALGKVQLTVFRLDAEPVREWNSRFSRF